MKKLLKLIFGTALLICLNTACSETPNSPVSTVNPDNAAAGDVDTEDKHELMSLKYEGKDLFGKACQLYISIDEDHGHEILAKLDYKLHGEELLDSEVSFQKYNIDNNTYSDINSKDTDSLPALASAILKGKDAEVDFNKLLDYERSGDLVQSMRIDFADVSHNAFTEALELVIEDDSLLEANKSVLNNIERVVGKISHNGHYDGLACLSFKLTEVKKIEYVIGSGHEDEHDDHGEDDHEDEHDHDDEHDDEDEHDEDDHGDHDHDHGAH